MKKKNLYKNELLPFNYNICYLFSKKNIRKLFFSKNGNLLLNVFEKLYIYNINVDDCYIDIFFIKYNIIKNIWFLFLIIYKLLVKKIKILSYKFFKSFLIKNLITNFFIIKKKKNKFFFFLNYNLKKIFKKNKLLKIFFLKIIKKKKRNFKIKILLKKYDKHKVNKKIKLHMPLFFFNKYSKIKCISLIHYFIEILNLKIKFKKAFICYWLRYYIYMLKRVYVYIEFILKKFINILNKWYKIIYLLVNLKKIKRKKRFFYYYFFFNNYKYRFLNKNKMYMYYHDIKKFIKAFFYKKIYYNIFFFNINKNINKKKKYFLNNLKNMGVFIKIKVLIILKNFFYMLFLQFFIFWYNNYLVRNDYVINLFNWNIMLKHMYINLIYFKSNKFNNLLFLKFNYFFFDNINF